ncbi:MAG TPA: 2-phospho-L-lactate transferase CofD family protein, partial [bacterium]|nr:2-phospho-L-lactate transferase CofD family protein [bacterium]
MTKRLQRWSRWFAPGIGVKRWTVLLLAGVLLVSAGAALIVNVQLLGWLEFVVFQAALSLLLLTGGSISPSLFGGILIVLGVGLVFFGLRGTIQAVAGALLPRGDTPLVEVLHQHRNRRRGRHLVAIGGGTGLSTLLRGLKAYTDNLTAVVTVFDDGGSSGRLRRELGILPPG